MGAGRNRTKKSPRVACLHVVSFCTRRERQLSAYLLANCLSADQRRENAHPGNATPIAYRTNGGGSALRSMRLASLNACSFAYVPAQTYVSPVSTFSIWSRSSSRVSIFCIIFGFSCFLHYVYSEYQVEIHGNFFMEVFYGFVAATVLPATGTDGLVAYAMRICRTKWRAGAARASSSTAELRALSFDVSSAFKVVS